MYRSYIYILLQIFSVTIRLQSDITQHQQPRRQQQQKQRQQFVHNSDSIISLSPGFSIAESENKQATYQKRQKECLIV